MKKLYQELAGLVDARLTCMAKGNNHWLNLHEKTIEAIVRQRLPHGSGFDCGTQIDLDKSNGEKLVFNTSFHHMDEWGGYDGWTSHQIVVKPSLIFGFTVDVKGRDRNGIKEYIAETFDLAMRQQEGENDGRI